MLAFAGEALVRVVVSLSVVEKGKKAESCAGETRRVNNYIRGRLTQKEFRDVPLARWRNKTDKTARERNRWSCTENELPLGETDESIQK